MGMEHTLLPTWKDVFKLKGCRFDPILIFIVLPIMVCLANLLKETGPQTVRYIYPVFSVAVVWVAIYLLQVKERSLFAFVALVTLWVAFNSLNNYRFYRDSGVVHGLIPVEKRLGLKEVKQFLSSEGIELAFSSYWTAIRAHSIDQKPVVISSNFGFYFNALTKPDLTKIQPFAIMTDEGDGEFIYHYMDKYLVRKTNHAVPEEGKNTIYYETLLKKKEIQYKKNRMGSYTIFWDFRGGKSRIEELWSTLKSDS